MEHRDRRPGRPQVGGVLPQPLPARQAGPHHARCQLHGQLFVGGVRQGRHRHLGTAGHRLPTTRRGAAAIRAARLPARHLVLVVPVLAVAREVPVRPRRAGRHVPIRQGGIPRRLGQGVGQHPGNPRVAQALPGGPRQGRIPADQLGGGARDRRRLDDPHDQQARPRPGRRILADPGDVAGQLRRREPVHVADRRRRDELLRLVLRPAAGIAGGVGRADRRPRVGRLVQRPLHRRDGRQPQHDPHARHALHLRGAPRRRQAGRVQPRLQPGRQVRRLVDPVAPRPGHRLLAGRRPRAADRVLPRPQGRLLRELLAPVHRPAVPGRDRGSPAGQIPASRPGRHATARPRTASGSC